MSFISKSNYICARAVLWNVGIFASIGYKIAQKVIAPRKFIVYYIECPSVVMLGKICNIFKEHDCGLFCVYRLADFKEHISAFIVKSFLLATYRKRLTRESRDQNIEIRNRWLIYLPNIALDQRNVRKVVAIGHTGVLIFIVRPYDGMPRLLQHQIDAADPAKEAANSHVNGLRN